MPERDLRANVYVNKYFQIFLCGDEIFSTAHTINNIICATFCLMMLFQSNSHRKKDYWKIRIAGNSTLAIA